jgi:dolichol-phosphate mannosyltransferase
MVRPAPRLLSVIVPLYNEDAVFPMLRAELSRVRGDFGCPVEIILVDDGSHDETYSLMHAWAREDPSVKTIGLSRNFGHQLAITAGLDACSGDAAVIMDADLQDPPALVPEMVKAYCEGYDVVYGQRTDREGESLFKRATATLFYWLMRKCVDRRLPPNTGDFRLVSRRVIDDLRRIREQDRFLRGLVAWVGYHQKALPYVRKVRAIGTTKYPLWQMMRLALTAIMSFSALPLRVITWLGFVSVLLCVGLIGRTLYQYWFRSETLVLGWASLFMVVTFFSGVTLMSIGMLGIYVAKIYAEVRGRPLYLVRHTTNFERPTANLEKISNGGH